MSEATATEGHLPTLEYQPGFLVSVRIGRISPHFSTKVSLWVELYDSGLVFVGDFGHIWRWGEEYPKDQTE